MATIHLALGNEGPVNEGERSVLTFLAENLPEHFELHPNLQISVGRGDLVECDIVVLGPDCVWIVEVKDLAGKVTVEEHEFWVNGEPRRHPVAQTRLKAQKIKNRLAVVPDLADVWVQPLVVLAREPVSLSIAPTMTSFVVSKHRSRAVLDDPTLVGIQAGRLPAPKRAKVRARLAIDSSTRQPRAKFGAYRATELLSVGLDRQWWLASQEVMGTSVLLEVIQIDPVLSSAEKEQRRSEAYRAAKVRARVGAYPYVLTPETAFNSDDGSVVVVHPNDPSPSLEERGAEVREQSDDFKRRVVGRIASAVDFCHSKGVVHRTIGPRCIFVPASGNARLGGFSRASFEGTSSLTVRPENWGALGTEFWAAPEHYSGRVGPEADLFALGSLIEFLWPEGAPGTLEGAAQLLLENDPSMRRVSAKELAALALPAAAVAVAPLPVKITSGAVLDDRYHIEQKLGGGASGTVWRATDSLLGQQVALKLYEGTDAGAEVMNEYQALLDLHHENIVKVRHAGKVSGRWVLVSEFLDGPSLRAAMPPAVPALSFDQAASTVLKVLSALAAMHPDMPRIVALADKRDRSDSEERELDRLRGKGITHRDVKPENIILVNGDRPVLVDFGLAAAGAVGAAGGTPQYRPAGVAFDHADPDLDLFAVAVVLHELLTGRHPYTDRDPVGGVLEIDPDLPEGVRDLLTRACSPRFEDRFRSAQDFMAALVALGVDEVPIPLPPLNVTERMRGIQNAIAERRWEDALHLCPADWPQIRDTILSRQELDQMADEQEPLLEIDGFSLRFAEIRRFVTATNTAGVEVGPGDARVYLVRGPAGEMLEIIDHIADSGDRWVAGGDTFETPMPLSRLRQGLRMSVNSQEMGGMAELRQARITNDNGWSNLFQATSEEMNCGAGVDVESALRSFGATDYGTRGAVQGEIGPRRNYLCMTVPADNEDAPAVAHFLTKTMPLARGVRQVTAGSGE